MSKFQKADFTAVPTESNFGKHIGLVEKLESKQATAATLASDLAGLSKYEGQIGDVQITVSNSPAAGESMVVDVKKNGTSVLTAPVTINAALITAKGKSFSIFSSIDKSKLRLSPGDSITVARTYTAGGAPAGLASVVSVEPSLAGYVGAAY